MLATYPQVAPSHDSIQLWIGIFDTATPAPPTVQVDKAPQAIVSVADPLRPIRDDASGPGGQALNHRTIVRISGLQPGTPYRVTVRGGDDERTLDISTLPVELPLQMDRWFNILLCSCYYQPEDASGTLGNVLTKILSHADMTLMLGDQVYGDLPLNVDLPGGKSMASMLGSKYFRNFASRALQTGGLTKVLQRAPAICVADDHEFWNNYPFRQAQLPNTWSASGRKAWMEAARHLYEDYQLGPGERPGFARRLDIAPLKLLIVDTRSERDEDFDKLFGPAAEAAVKAWADDLLAERQAGRPAFGLLCSGQTLFAQPTPDSKRVSSDAELSNWAQFDELVVRQILERLADADIPVIYVTGDVHWGRVAQARDRQRDNRPMIYEVISSPSTLIRVPVRDRGLELLEQAKGLFGKGKRWPRHHKPDPVPDKLGGGGRFKLECKLEVNDLGFHHVGDQVAMLSLRRSGGGIDFRVTYFEVSGESSGASSAPTRIYSLRNF